MNIQIEVEGTEAIEATQELFAIEGIDGTWEQVTDEREPLTLATIGTIVGIVGGSMAIAELIYQWYHRYEQGKNNQKIEKVLLVGRNGDRILLKNASIEQIRKILDS